MRNDDFLSSTLERRGGTLARGCMKLCLALRRKRQRNCFMSQHLPRAGSKPGSARNTEAYTEALPEKAGCDVVATGKRHTHRDSENVNGTERLGQRDTDHHLANSGA
jgi:hypothetical protein